MYAVSHSWYVFHSLKWDELCLVYVKLSHFLVETSHIELTYNAKHCKRYHNYLLKRILSLKWSHHQTTCTGLFSFVISVNINFRIREVCIPHTWKVTSLEMYLTASLCGSHSVTPHPHDLIWRDKPFVWRYSPMNSSLCPVIWESKRRVNFSGERRPVERVANLTSSNGCIHL